MSRNSGFCRRSLGLLAVAAPLSLLTGCLRTEASSERLGSTSAESQGPQPPSKDAGSQKKGGDVVEPVRKIQTKDVVDVVKGDI